MSTNKPTRLRSGTRVRVLERFKVTSMFFRNGIAGRTGRVAERVCWGDGVYVILDATDHDIESTHFLRRCDLEVLDGGQS